MIAIREIYDVTAGSVLVRLPTNFPTKRVEIIILPVEEETLTRRQRLQALLLAGPVLPEDELKSYEAIQDWMNQWQLPNF